MTTSWRRSPEQWAEYRDWLSGVLPHRVPDADQAINFCICHHVAQALLEKEEEGEDGLWAALRDRVLRLGAVSRGAPGKSRGPPRMSDAAMLEFLRMAPRRVACPGTPRPIVIAEEDLRSGVFPLPSAPRCSACAAPAQIRFQAEAD